MRVVRRALILLKSDEGLTDDEIGEHVGCSDRTVRSVRKRFCTESLDARYLMHLDLVLRQRSRHDNISG